MSEADHSPWKKTQRRYAAYCVAHGAVCPEEMIARDRRRYPGGVMAGYIIWIGARWSEWDADTKHSKSFHDDEDHAQFDQWLAAKALMGTPTAEPTRQFYYSLGPSELTEHPSIYMESPTGGDPLIICTIGRVYRPELLDQLCARDCQRGEMDSSRLGTFCGDAPGFKSRHSRVED